MYGANDELDEHVCVCVLCVCVCARVYACVFERAWFVCVCESGKEVMSVCVRERERGKGHLPVNWQEAEEEKAQALEQAIRELKARETALAEEISERDREREQLQRLEEEADALRRALKESRYGEYTREQL